MARSLLIDLSTESMRWQLSILSVQSKHHGSNRQSSKQRLYLNSSTNSFHALFLPTLLSKSLRDSLQLTKLPGSVSGQPFNIIDCKDCTITILDYCDQVQIDNVSNSKIFIGASSGSIFVRNCHNCTFTVACKQLRTRDCNDCTLYLYCKTEPIIECSEGMKFAPFNGAYPDHDKAMNAANLDPKNNLWYAVYDFNDELKSKKNWSILNESDEDGLWCPLGAATNFCPRILPEKASKELSIKTNEKDADDGLLCEISLDGNDDDEVTSNPASRSLEKRKEERKTSLKKKAIGSEDSIGNELVYKVTSLCGSFFEMFLTGVSLSSLPSKVLGWVSSWRDGVVAFFQKQEDVCSSTCSSSSSS